MIRWPDAREDAFVERFVPAGPPPRPLGAVSRLADGGRLWWGLGAGMAAAPRMRSAAVEAVVAGLLAAGTTQVVQRAVPRPRPPADHPVRRALAVQPGSPSFPSSHTAVATAFVTALARRRPRLAALLAPLAATLALGRVRLRVHRPTDVLGGAVVGVLAGAAVRPVHRRLRRGRRPARRGG